jgi:arginine decarboxylase
MSVAYGLEEYASSIVQAVRLKCDYHGIPHPVLCTESGRAMASHHSMIILEALSAIPTPKDDDHEATTEKLHGLIRDLSSKLQPSNSEGTGMSMSSYAMDIKKHGIEIYKLGKKLSKSVAVDTHTIYNYHMNLSIFSLIPDYQVIHQAFPMIPVSRLNEKPTHLIGPRSSTSPSTATAKSTSS